MIEVKTRTGEVIYTSETATTVREAIEDAAKEGADLAGADLADANLAHANLAHANLARAYLAGAYLARANLADANLARANLARANLARANLADANLAGANLADANLARANLAGAYLADANLADAYLAGVNLARAYLAGAYLADAYLAHADLTGADLTGADLADANLADANLADAYLAGVRNVPRRANLGDPVEPPEPYRRPIAAADYARIAERYRKRHPEVPVVPNIDRQILARIESGGSLDMANWHTCETTHCRAGWAIVLAGEAGRQLEEERGPFHAGAMIYRASTGRVPHFFASDERALEDLRACAAEQAENA